MRSEIGLIGALLALGLFGCGIKPPLPPTPLFAGLSGKDWEDPEASSLLRQRISERFPIGRSEVGLAEYLSSQGMRTQTAMSSETGTRDLRAYWVGAVGLCRTPVEVAWRVDRAGRLSEISVRYSDTGCL
jgi:hypothetical protein